MADQITSDLLMKFAVTPTTCIEGEGGVDLDKKNEMAMGFQKGSIIELESFTFHAGNKDQEDDEKKAANKGHAEEKRRVAEYNRKLIKAFRASGAKGEPDLLPDPTEPRVEGYSKWRAGEKVTYPADVQPIEITRPFDKSSVSMMQHCIKRTTFDSATLIKRKAAGGAAAGEIYLRVDFTGVLLIKVDWDDDQPIKTKMSFIARAITIAYKPQLPDGSLGAVVPGFWTMTTDLKAVVLRRG